MNAIKSLFQNVVNVKAHSSETIQTKDSTSSSPSDTKIEDVQNTSKSTLSENPPESKLQLTADNDTECKVLQETVFDLIRGIIDPEKPQTLEDLDVVKEEDVYIYRHEKEMWIKLVFTPTVPHCSLASLIGLCLRSKLEINLPDKHKLDIYIKQGTHSTADEINKQINDKERIAAAMENPNLRDLVNKCIADEG